MQDSVVTQQQIDALERVLDKVFAQVGIDVEFTRHFLDRVNDERNRKQITVKELALLFKKEFQRWGKEIAKLGPDQEAVMKDLDSDINIPFALKWNGSELELIAKTVMRKPNFRTTNKEFPVENIEDYAANFVKEMRTTLEREISEAPEYTGSDVMAEDPPIGIDFDFDNLSKVDWDSHSDKAISSFVDYLENLDFEDGVDVSGSGYSGSYGKAAAWVEKNVLNKRKTESTETNPKHAVPDNRFTPGMNKGGEGVAQHKTNKSLKRAIGEDNNMVPDHEVSMAKSDLYNLAKNSIRLYELMLDISEAEGLEGWQQSKITQANDYITSVYQSLSHDAATASTQAELPESLDDDEVDEFHKDLDNLVHKHLGHSSDELDEAAPKIDPDKWAEYQASKQKPKKVSSTQKSLASIRQKTEGGMKRIATTQSNKAERIGAGGKAGLETFKKKDTTEATDCWDGYAPGAQSGVKTKPGTGKNKGKRVNNCEPINKK